jgi:hypothetical protein
VRMPDSTDAPQVRKTTPSGPERPRIVCLTIWAMLMLDHGIFTAFFPAQSVRYHPAVTVVFVGMSDPG